MIGNSTQLSTCEGGCQMFQMPQKWCFLLEFQHFHEFENMVPKTIPILYILELFYFVFDKMVSKYGNRFILSLGQAKVPSKFGLDFKVIK